MEISIIESSTEATPPLCKVSSKKKKFQNACKACVPRLYHSITKAFAILLIYGTLWGLLGEYALPGSNIFAILLLVVICQIGGELIALIKMPPLLGMLLFGFLYRNLPFIPYYNDISPKWAAAFRSAALSIIMLRAGLSLDPVVLRRLSFACFRLSFLPCSIEAVAAGIVAHYLLQMPLALSFCLGFVLAAVSPAVVIPTMLLLEEKGFGQDKGIATLIIAATALENVYAITFFGVCIGIAFAKGNLVWTIIKGPLAVIVGLAYGAVVGVLCWQFPYKLQNQRIFYRVILLTFSGFAITFMSQALDFAAAGALGCLGVSFVAALKWRDEEDKNVVVSDVESGMWAIFETFLFSLIGIEVSIQDIQRDIGYGIAILVIGLIFRITMAFFCVFKSGLNFKENVFVAFAWLPKATVQAAVGSVALDIARAANLSQEYIIFGQQILTIAVLSIIFTAPLGAVLITLLGPLFLHKDEKLNKDVASEEIVNNPRDYGTLSKSAERITSSTGTNTI